MAPTAKIIVCGFSLGSSVALRAALSERVSGIVTIGAFTRLSALAPKIARPLIGGMFDNMKLVRLNMKPILLVHGTRDQAVPIEHSYALAGEGGGHARIARIDGAPHHMDLHQVASIILRNSHEMPDPGG